MVTQDPGVGQRTESHYFFLSVGDYSQKGGWQRVDGIIISGMEKTISDWGNLVDFILIIYPAVVAPRLGIGKTNALR